MNEVMLWVYLKIQKWVRSELSVFYFDKDLKPIRCTKCGSSDIKRKTVDTIEYIECESELSCNECGSLLGYWAYGFYDPAFKMGYIDIGYFDADKEAQYNREFDECFGGCGDSIT